MFLVLFIYFLEKNKLICSSLTFSFAVLIKFLPLMLLPLIYKMIGIKKFLILSSILLLTSIFFYIPFVSDGLNLFNHLFKYLQHWEFNGSVYLFIKMFSNGEIAREVCSVLLFGTVIFITIKGKDLLTGIYYIFLAYFIFTTTLYPWYLGWGAALNPFFGFFSLMSLFFTVNFSNFTPLAEVWTEYTIVILLEYIPFFLLLIYDLRRERKLKNQDRVLS